MKKPILTLEAAKLVATHTNHTLPLVRGLEGEKVNLAQLAVRIATRAVKTASEEERALAERELQRAQLVLKEQIAAHPKNADEALQKLKKLANPTDKSQMPVRLPPRRLRREARRVLVRSAWRAEVLERRLSAIVTEYQDKLRKQVPGAPPVYVEVDRVSAAAAPSASELLTKVMEKLGLRNEFFRGIPVTSRKGRSRFSWNLVVFKEKTDFALAQ